MTRVSYTINYAPRGLRHILTGLTSFYRNLYNPFGMGTSSVDIFDVSSGGKHRLIVDFLHISKAKQEKVLGSLETILAKLEIEFEKQK